MTSKLKQAYTKPQLTVHGDVEKITLSGVLMNADVNGGPNGTANCPANSTDPACLGSP